MFLLRELQKKFTKNTWHEQVLILHELVKNTKWCQHVPSYSHHVAVPVNNGRTTSHRRLFPTNEKQGRQCWVRNWNPSNNGRTAFYKRLFLTERTNVRSLSPTLVTCVLDLFVRSPLVWSCGIWWNGSLKKIVDPGTKPVILKYTVCARPTDSTSLQRKR